MNIELTVNGIPSFGTTGGASAAAQFVAEQLRQGLRRLMGSNSLGLAPRRTLEQLYALADDCSAQNWDGYGASPVIPETIWAASCFLEALPIGTPMPIVGAEPDGQVTFEWYRSPRRILSVSVSPEGEIHYAALLGSSKAYGTEPFFGEMPRVILQLIHRVGSDERRNHADNSEG
jgi:hypothetical protein